MCSAATSVEALADTDSVAVAEVLLVDEVVAAGGVVLWSGVAARVAVRTSPANVAVIRFVRDIFVLRSWPTMVAGP